MPLSDTISCGLPRPSISAVSSRATRRPEIEVSGSCQALHGDVIDVGKDAEAATAGELVVDEIERPAGVRLGLDEDRGAGSYRLATSSALAHG